MARSDQWVKENFGVFTWTAHKTRRGLIVPNPKWVDANIVTLPNRWGLVTPYGTKASLRCHIKAAAKIAAALNDLAGQGLLPLIETWDGCYVARHKCWNPARGLSRHAWGIAVDVNARNHPYGRRIAQPAKVYNAFCAHGFEWGGCWRTPDSMHFELVEV